MNKHFLRGIGALVLVGGAALAFGGAQERARFGVRAGEPGGVRTGTPVDVGARAGRPESPAARGGVSPSGAQRGMRRDVRRGFEPGARGEGRPGLRMRLQRGRELARSLQVTEAQRELAREAARDLKPTAEELRPQMRGVLERARALRRAGDADGARELLRAELRPLIERAKAHAERATGPIVESLTGEQRAKLEEAARRRGAGFDERRFSHRLGLLLGSRRAQDRLR